MQTIPLLFCGSFMNYSAEVLAGLLTDSRFEIIAVVTTPPAQIKHVAHPNPVHVVAEQHGLTVYTPEVLDENILRLIEEKNGLPQVLLTAGYGKLLPESWLTWPSRSSLNLHFSDLPKYRGANPAEWALLFDEHQTGITLIEMSPEFDTGKMVSQATIDIESDDTRESIYHKLYTLGGEVVGEMIANYLQPKESSEAEVAGHQLKWWQPPFSQDTSPTPYAKRLTREDGFVAWPTVQTVLQGNVGTVTDFSPVLQKILQLGTFAPDAFFLERMIRALTGFPGVWTIIPTQKGDKRLKLLDAQIEQGHLKLLEVQLEGQQPAQWNQIKNVVSEVAAV